MNAEDITKKRELIAACIAAISTTDAADPRNWSSITRKAEEAGLTKYILCKELGAGASTIDRWKDGQTAPGPHARQSIKDHLLNSLKEMHGASNPFQKEAQLVTDGIDAVREADVSFADRWFDVIRFANSAGLDDATIARRFEIAPSTVARWKTEAALPLPKMRQHIKDTILSMLQEKHDDLITMPLKSIAPKKPNAPGL